MHDHEAMEQERQRAWYRRAWLNAVHLASDWEKKTGALEDKLRRVRAWHAKYGLPQEGGDELAAILEGP